MSHSMLRNIVDRIQKESICKSKDSLFSITVDETSDTSRTEQVNLHVRFGNNSIETEMFFWDSTKQGTVIDHGKNIPINANACNMS